MYSKRILIVFSHLLFFTLLLSCNEKTTDNDGNAEHVEHEHNAMDDDHVKDNEEGDDTH